MSDHFLPAVADPDSKADSDLARVLIVHEEVSTSRLIREALEGFTLSQVDSTPNAEYAFERALQRDYALFIFSLTMPILHGELLFDLISKAYRFCHAGARSAPPIIYLGEEKHRVRIDELQRDARVRGVLLKPLRIDRVLEKARSVLPSKQPM
ncbi:MAG: DNA-binding response OmpR family regulator [Verrucomicrobiales bacterium]|jgi:DNA-binding response OmpR family regulator